MRLPAIIVAGLLTAVFFVADSPKAKAQTAETEAAQQQIVEVQKGDSLSKIANAHQTTYHRVFDANLQIKDPDIIYPGDKLRIPKPDEQLENRQIPADTPPPVATTKKSSAAKKQPVAQRKRASRQAAVSSTSVGGDVWDRLAQCESGGNWSINTGNGYYGGLQFSAGSWRGVGGSGTANQASREEQIARAQQLQAKQGWGAWPACSRKLGLR